MPAAVSCPEFLRLQAAGRREFLRVGGLGALGLSLPALFAAEARASDSADDRPPARAKSCILLFLAGGPSQFETFDPKPDAPAENRSIFGTVATKVPGLRLCEHLPDLAPLANRFAVVRSAWHKYGGHFGGHRYALTGHAAPGNADQPARADDKPGLVGLAGKHLRGAGGMPAAVMAPWLATDQGSGASGGMGGGTLGRQFDPVMVDLEPGTERPGRAPAFRVPEFSLRADVGPERFGGRRGLLDRIEAQRRELFEAEVGRDFREHYRRAYDLLTSPKIRQAFDLSGEDPRARDRYGMNAFGQSCLLARRLVERGARFVQVNFCRSVTQPGYGWDTHDKGHATLKDQLLPKLNAGLASLLADLDGRGLLQETLVLVMGEFGRTPRVKRDGGRDHWSQCYSLLLAGGGVHGGLVYGRSDRKGAHPASDPVEARGILLTALTLLGVPSFGTDALGRAAPLFEGAEPVRRLYE